jgi:excisionase family DNA binding protein
MSKWLTTGQCAERIGLTDEYIRGEIKDGRLPAREHRYATSGRVRYRIEPEDFDAYVERHWPKLKAS